MSHPTDPHLCEWRGPKGVQRFANTPANVRPYMAALGKKEAVRFLLAFGGAPVQISSAPRPGSMVHEFLGTELTTKLAHHLLNDGRPGDCSGLAQVPIASRFLARSLRGSGVSILEIARRLRRTDTTIRAFLEEDADHFGKRSTVGDDE